MDFAGVFFQKIPRCFWGLYGQKLIPKGARNKPGMPALHLITWDYDFGFAGKERIADTSHASFFDLGLVAQTNESCARFTLFYGQSQLDGTQHFTGLISFVEDSLNRLSDQRFNLLARPACDNKNIFNS
jgi:hypothetical protein